MHVDAGITYAHRTVDVHEHIHMHACAHTHTPARAHTHACPRRRTHLSKSEAFILAVLSAMTMWCTVLPSFVWVVRSARERTVRVTARMQMPPKAVRQSHGAHVE